MKNRMPYQDGLSPVERNQMRKRAWTDSITQSEKAKARRRSSSWTEKLCSHCSQWHRKGQEAAWCNGFKIENGMIAPESSGAPTIHTFKPYFNPNIQPGGVFVETAAQERRAMKLNRVEHGA